MPRCGGRRKKPFKKSSSSSSSSDSEDSKSSSSSQVKKNIPEEVEDSFSGQEKNNINIYKNSEDLIKCYICLNQSFDPVICRFCGNIACKKCFNQWLKNKNSKCGCCRKNITKDDLIAPPIIKNINNYINKLQEEINHEMCKIHQEKILFFCMKCLKKYCGKCLYFGSEEAKIHQGHNIIDYSQLKSSQYIDIINKLETSKDNKDKIEEVILKNESYKEEIKTIFDNSKTALKYFQKMIENKLQEKINSVSKFSGELKDAKYDLEKNNNEIILNLSKLEKIDKQIENFDVNKSKEELDLLLNKINLLTINSIHMQNKEIKIDFKLNYFSIIKNYNELVSVKDKFLLINEPLLIKMKLVEVEEKEGQSFLKIIIQSKNKTSFFVFILLKFNNKIYHFELKDKEDNNDDIKINVLDELKEKEGKKVYITSIPKNELSQTNNIFYFSNYIFSID